MKGLGTSGTCYAGQIVNDQNGPVRGAAVEWRDPETGEPAGKRRFNRR
jgi:hypothetical protein